MLPNKINALGEIILRLRIPEQGNRDLPLNARIRKMPIYVHDRGSFFHNIFEGFPGQEFIFGMAEMKLTVLVRKKLVKMLERGCEAGVTTNGWLGCVRRASQRQIMCRMPWKGEISLSADNKRQCSSK